jgi:hypothetical protein
LSCVAVLAACPEPTGSPDAGPGGEDAGVSGADAGADAGRLDRDGGFDAGPVDGADAGRGDGGVDAGGAGSDAGADAGLDGGFDGGPSAIVVVTFNTGTGATNGVDGDGDSWTSTEQGIGDTHYGNGLAWLDAIDGTAQFFAALQPDIVAFQEIFHPAECANIPSELHAGFVCETWDAGEPTVAQMVLGDGYQVACNLEKPDKCAAVKLSFGSFRGCDGGLCLDHLDGAEPSGCGNGSRIGRGTIDLAAGGELTVVLVHGTSGVSGDDADCRVAQTEQVFVDLDGEPAANGARNIVLGDLNTDPIRAALLDSSARRWNDFVGDDKAFHWVSDIGFDAEPTYANSLNIDHVISDVFTGSCRVPGVAGEPPVLPTVHFDHKPIVCEVAEP